MLTYISQGGLGGDVPPFYFSWGLRTGGEKLAKAYPGKVRLEHFDHTQDDQVLAAIVAASNRGDKIMCTNHSLAANDFVNKVLPACAARGIIVDCGIMCDPTWNVWAAKVGNSVRRLINFYNTDWLSALGKRQVYPTDDFKGHLANISLDVMHQVVDDDLHVHGFILREGGYLITGLSQVLAPDPLPQPPTEMPPMQQQATPQPIPVSTFPTPKRDLRNEFPPTDNIG